MSRATPHIPRLSHRPPALSADQMRRINQIMTDGLRIGLLQMMENAGRALSGLAWERYRPGTATILAGPGGNGGGGLAGGRHLLNRGVVVTVVLSRPLEDMQAAAVAQVESLQRLGARPSTDPLNADLIIDALVGYSIRGNPSGRAAELIRWANDASSPTLALDLPSGLDPTTGIPGTPTVTADATLTLALPKRGLFRAPSLVGDLYLGDIGVPARAYRSLGLEVADPFDAGPVVQVP